MAQTLAPVVPLPVRNAAPSRSDLRVAAAMTAAGVTLAMLREHVAADPDAPLSVFLPAMEALSGSQGIP